MILNAFYRLHAAKIDEKKFFNAFKKAAKDTGLAEKLDVYQRGRGLALGVVLKKGKTLQQFMRKLGWDEVSQGQYERGGEWPLFVGQAGPNAYAIQLQGAGESQSMKKVASNLSEALPHFQVKVYGSDAVFTRELPDMFSLAPALEEVQQFAAHHKFRKGKTAMEMTSEGENLKMEMSLRYGGSLKGVELALAFSFLG